MDEQLRVMQRRLRLNQRVGLVAAVVFVVIAVLLNLWALRTADEPAKNRVITKHNAARTKQSVRLSAAAPPERAMKQSEQERTLDSDGDTDSMPSRKSIESDNLTLDDLIRQKEIAIIEGRDESDIPPAKRVVTKELREFFKSDK